MSTISLLLVERVVARVAHASGVKVSVRVWAPSCLSFAAISVVAHVAHASRVRKLVYMFAVRNSHLLFKLLSRVHEVVVLPLGVRTIG